MTVISNNYISQQRTHQQLCELTVVHRVPRTCFFVWWPLSNDCKYPSRLHLWKADKTQYCCCYTAVLLLCCM